MRSTVFVLSPNMDLRSTKYPPAMYDPYHEWKNELKAWKHLTDLAVEKHGAALLRSLTEDAKKAAQKVANQRRTRFTGPAKISLP